MLVTVTGGVLVTMGGGDVAHYCGWGVGNVAGYYNWPVGVACFWSL